jgi:hypothetical protein
MELGQTPIAMALGGHQEVPVDWMSATGAQAILLEDPALVWLKYHGQKHGLQPDSSPYEFLDFVAEKGQQFEDAWLDRMAPEAAYVCLDAQEVRSANKVVETFELMQQGIPVIAQAALWWAPERIYGVPDAIVHTSWLAERLPNLIEGIDWQAPAKNLAHSDKPGHYVVLDFKFTSRLDSGQKAKVLDCYAAQVRIYSHMLGQLQGVMPAKGFLVARDRVFDPLPVEIKSVLGGPLDDDLTIAHDHFVDIKVNGANYAPWRDAIVASNIAHRDEQWHTAKHIIAHQKMPGRDPGIVYQLGPRAKRDLARKGFPHLDSMLERDPADLPLEACAGLGPANSKRIRAILEANRSGSPLFPRSVSVPPKKEFEFYVDFEYLTNVNVDFERQWPTLDGCEMMFMVGVGWDDHTEWSYETFVARAENHAAERRMVEEFIEFLQDRTGGALLDNDRTSIYHWTLAEVWMARRVAKRHGYPQSHPLRELPWSDLQQVFLRGPIAIPGAWTFQLKDVTRALGRINPDFDPRWPGDLDQGLRAMVMGWKAYSTSRPLQSPEMDTLRMYLEADCRALWQILKWVRTQAT